MFACMLFNLAAALREILDQVLRYPANLKQAGARIELDPKSVFAQRECERIPVDLPRRALLLIHEPALKARHSVIGRPVGHVEYDQMGMEVRIEVAAAVLGEARDKKPSGRLADDLALGAVA